MAQMISSLRMSRWPIFEVLPRICLPPVDFCRGTRPSQAAKSRPLRNSCIGGAKASIAIAPIGPIPGMVWRRVAVFVAAALLRMDVSRSAIFSAHRAI